MNREGKIHRISFPLETNNDAKEGGIHVIYFEESLER